MARRGLNWCDTHTRYFAANFYVNLRLLSFAGMVFLPFDCQWHVWKSFDAAAKSRWQPTPTSSKPYRDACCFTDGWRRTPTGTRKYLYLLVGNLWAAPIWIKNCGRIFRNRIGVDGRNVTIVYFKLALSLHPKWNKLRRIDWENSHVYLFVSQVESQPEFSFSAKLNAENSETIKYRCPLSIFHCSVFSLVFATNSLEQFSISNKFASSKPLIHAVCVHHFIIYSEVVASVCVCSAYAVLEPYGN